MAFFYLPYMIGWSQDSDGFYNNIGVIGNTIITNGGFNTWSSPTNLSSWNAFTNGTSTVNQESVEVQEGVNSVRFDIDASNNLAYITQAAGGIQHGKWIRATYYWKVNSGTATASFQSSIGTLITADYARTITTSWQGFTDTARNAGTTAYTAKLTPVSAAGKSVYLDNLSIFLLDESMLYAVAINNTANTDVNCKIKTHYPGTQSGVIGWLDSYSNKKNFIQAYWDGSKLRLEKCVNGTYTVLIELAGTFVTNATLEIRRPSGNNFELWYNGSQVGTTQTISDAGIISNTLFGLMNTHPTNRISDFRIGGVQLDFLFALADGQSKDRGYALIKRNNTLVSVYAESLLLPFVHAGWTVDANELIGGTGVAVPKAIPQKTNQTVSASIHNYSTGEVGIFSHYDGSNNYIKAYYDGTNLKMDKVVAGVTTNLISVASAFVAGASIEIRRISTLTFQMWYNGSQVNVNKNISDTAIQNGQYCALYSSSALNRFRDLVVNGDSLPFILT